MAALNNAYRFLSAVAIAGAGGWGPGFLRRTLCAT